jgi:hypothetical protein
MTTILDFLTAVLPTQGEYRMTVIRPGHGATNLPALTLTDLASAIGTGIAMQDSRTGSGSDVPQIYHACASYAPDRGDRRKAIDAAFVRSLWVDIDCGKSSDPEFLRSYPSQRDAVSALSGVCTEHFLPPTAVVNSGTGVHAYWRLDRDLTAAEWVPMAAKFKALLALHGIKADPSRTADIASVLRPPGTVYKAGPSRVGIVYIDEIEHPVGDVEALLEHIDATATHVTPEVLAERKALHKEYDFQYLVTKALAGEGCNQMRRIVEQGGNVTEPLWRAGLSIVAHSNATPEKQIRFIRLVSAEHPQYDEDEALRKMRGIQAPYNCRAFADINPEGCAGCPYDRSTSITSPVTTGYEAMRGRREIEACEAAEYAATMPLAVMPADPFMAAVPREVVEPAATVEQPEAPMQVFAAPTYSRSIDDFALTPKPQHRHSRPFMGHAHIPMLAEDSEGVFLEGEWQLNPGDGALPSRLERLRDTGLTAVFQRESKTEAGVKYYTVDRMAYTTPVVHGRVGYQDEARLLMSVATPMNGSVYRELPMSVLSVGGDTLKKFLGVIEAPIAGNSERFKLFIRYFIACAKRLGCTEKDRIAAAHFGWADDGTFHLGDSILCGDRVKEPSMPTGQKAEHAKKMRALGKASAWVDTVSRMYPNSQPGVQALQFMVLAGFGAPVYAARDGSDVGGIIHAVSPVSGTGKTTAMRVASTIYGDREMLLTTPETTPAARIKLQATLHSLPLCVDEITRVAGANLTQWVMSSTQGKEKARSTKDGDALQANPGEWRSYAMTTANTSLVDTVASEMKEDSSGATHRILEITIPAIEHAGIESWEADELLGQNCGVVGPIWADHIVTHKAAIMARISEEAKAIRALDGAQGKERYWNMMVASVLAAGEEAARLGLHTFDMAAVRAWAYELLGSQRTTAALVQHHVTPADVLSEVLHNHNDQFIVISKGQSAPAVFGMPDRRTSGRFDFEKGRFCVVSSVINDIARQRGLSAKALRAFCETGLGGRMQTVRLHAGVPNTTSAPSRCWVFDTARSTAANEFFVSTLNDAEGLLHAQ